MAGLEIAILEAIIGGVAHECLEYYEAGTYEVFKDTPVYLVLSAIAGFTWWVLGMPNHFNLILVGFNAPAIISMLFKRTEKIRKKIK